MGTTNLLCSIDVLFISVNVVTLRGRMAIYKRFTDTKTVKKPWDVCAYVCMRVWWEVWELGVCMGKILPTPVFSCVLNSNKQRYFLKEGQKT